VLAESHYDIEGTVKKTRRYTIQTVNRHAMQTPLRFFRMIASALTGKSYSLVNTKHVFERIAFSNFIQDLLTESRRSPSSSQWKRGCLAFPEQMEILRPTHLIVCGYRLWDNWLPEFDGGSPGVEVGQIGRRKIRQGTITLPKVGRVRALGIMHPSSAFSPDFWHPIIQKFKGFDIGCGRITLAERPTNPMLCGKSGPKPGFVRNGKTRRAITKGNPLRH
jgi:hypothetical protein